MSEVNYNETVVIPLLQKKFQELINSNLILEVSLLVEQAKNKNLQNRVDALEKKLDSTKKRKKEDGLDGNTY